MHAADQGGMFLERASGMGGGRSPDGTPGHTAGRRSGGERTDGNHRDSVFTNVAVARAGDDAEDRRRSGLRGVDLL